MSQQGDQSYYNKEAWNYRAYEHWNTHYGLPAQIGLEIKNNPQRWLQYYLNDIGDVSGKRVANLLGSSGLRAVALAVLGANVTVVDISEENARYANELANEAGVSINYLVSDVNELSLNEMKGQYDLVFLEFGILHYFSDLRHFAKITYTLLRDGGKLLLRDFHPIHKFVQVKKDGSVHVSGNYFDIDIKEDSIAYEDFFPAEERPQFPKTYLRKWTMAEIISAFAAEGYIIRKMTEEPNKYNSNIPGNFMIIADREMK